MHSLPDSDIVLIGTLSTINKPPELIDDQYSYHVPVNNITLKNSENSKCLNINPDLDKK